MTNAERRQQRIEKAERVAALRAEGLTCREVAERLGTTVHMARRLSADPTGDLARAQQRERRERNAVTCDVCGQRHKGRSGKKTCQRCERRRVLGTPIKPRERVRCGFKGCDAEHLDGELMCAEHKPIIDAIREDFEREERASQPGERAAAWHRRQKLLPSDESDQELHAIDAALAA